MDFSFELSGEQEEFAREVSAWLDENVPGDLEYIRDTQKMSAEQYEKHRAFMRVLGAKGWLWPTQPREYGGGGLDPALGAMVGREMAKRRLALPPIHDLTSLASTAILAHGTEEQKKRFLTKMFTGHGLSWQTFTEPEAGTDAANQQTNALRHTRDGDHFIINGQKIFVGTIHPPPDFMLLLTRSDAKAPRHQNLSAFICPGNLPGITIQPLDLFTLSPFMAICGVTGANVDAIKNSVFFDDVRIHESYLLGAEGDGWNVAQTALMSEHGAGRPETGKAAPRSSSVAKPLPSGATEEPGPTNYMLQQFLAQCKNNPGIVKRLKENPQLINSLVDTYIFAMQERAFSIRNLGGKGGGYGGPQLMLYQKRSGAKFGADMAAVFGPVALTDDPEWVLDEGLFEVGERCSICQAPSGTPEAMKILISRALSIGR